MEAMLMVSRVELQIIAFLKMCLNIDSIDVQIVFLQKFCNLLTITMQFGGWASYSTRNSWL